MRIYQKFITLCVALSSLTITAEAVELMPDVAKSSTIVFINGKKYYVHTVAEGDTLYSLSKVYGVSQESIIEVNKLKSNDIRVGSTVYVPMPSLQQLRQSRARNPSSRAPRMENMSLVLARRYTPCRASMTSLSRSFST